MVDAIGEILASAGQVIAEDSDFMKEKSERKSALFRLLSYVIPMTILTGIYLWVVYN
tara:strand:+ start:179 stop:349 length:171 start_codon:yes stop_codon:yes gene_type:complete